MYSNRRDDGTDDSRPRADRNEVATPSDTLAARDNQHASRRQMLQVCDDALQWADDRDYSGWDPYDGLNSPYFSPLRRHWLTRLVGIHLVAKAPVNLRDVLSVPEERNPKGVALFAMSYLNLYRATGADRHLVRAESLLGWLRDNGSPGYEGAWGYNFDWQNGRKFFLPSDAPSIVVSVFCARAFLDHYEATGDKASLATARETVRFIRSEINTETVGGRTAYTYTPHDSFVVVNANALAMKFFTRVAAHTDDTSLSERAAALADLVIATQTDTGAWYYAVPAEESHLSHDNFHTGFVLESLDGYLTENSDPAVEHAYRTGMAFFDRYLFEPDGAPRFEHDRAYPRDAHAAGQAIRTFVRAGTPAARDRAAAVATWALDMLYDEAGYFYRYRSYVDDTTPYIRWSQAWMCYGLSTYLAATADTGDDRIEPARSDDDRTETTGSSHGPAE